MLESKKNPPPATELSSSALRRLERRYQALKKQLQELGWVAQGSVSPQPPHAWRLTRKVKAKTVSLALTADQALLYKEAIANHRQLEDILNQMRAISEEVLQKSLPGVRKRSHPDHPK
jgi:cell wall-associated NlpC family hydrolase